MGISDKDLGASVRETQFRCLDRAATAMLQLVAENLSADPLIRSGIYPKLSNWPGESYPWRDKCNRIYATPARGRKSGTDKPLNHFESNLGSPLSHTAKNILKKWRVFRLRKSTMQHTTIHHESATMSPRLTIQKHTRNRKTPCKNHLFPVDIFFFRLKLKTSRNL